MSEPNSEESSPLNPKLRHAMGLISAQCDDRITPEQFAELETLLRDDLEVGRFYVSVMQLHAALHHFAFYLSQPLTDELAVGDLGGDPRGAQPLGMDETMMLPAMPQPAISEVGLEGEIYQPRSVLSESTETRKRGPLSPYLKGGIAAILLMGFGVLAYTLFGSRGKNSGVNSVPQQSKVVAVVPPLIPIATVERSAKAIWGTGNAPADGIFAAGQVLSLTSGDVQLSLHRGGRMVVEGPAEIEFESDAVISLHRGKLVATVPGGGLVVTCPTGSVTDLGTEFALAVDSQGQTEVAVFKGRVSASLASVATTQSAQPLLLSVGQAAVMTDKTLSRSPEGAVPQRYVCNLVNDSVTSLDVTDLISGGDGTTHRRGIGINPNTGEIGAMPPVREIISDGKYHRVTGYPVIDGTFVPDGTRDRMDVDSAGHQFSFAGAGNSAYNNVYTGGPIPWPVTPTISTVLGGVDYSSPDHAITSIHPNNAVTLDLKAIRRIYPDRALVNFHCRVGRTSTADPTRTPVAAVYVLVDGVARYQEQHFSGSADSLVVQVSIQPRDRFVTLISTDAREKGRIDWIVWMDPKIDLSAQQ